MLNSANAIFKITGEEYTTPTKMKHTALSIIDLNTPLSKRAKRKKNFAFPQNSNINEAGEEILPDILSDLHLTIGQTNATLNIYKSETKLCPFLFECPKMIDVIVKFSLDDDLNSAETDLATAMHGLGTVIAQKGEIPNCGYVPSNNFSVIGMFNYAPLEEKNHETDLDKDTFNLTHPNSSCLRVWAKTVPELLGSCNSGYLDSFHFIDLRCWAFTIDLKAGS
jgi:hypothetical protein